MSESSSSVLRRKSVGLGRALTPTSRVYVPAASLAGRRQLCRLVEPMAAMSRAGFGSPIPGGASREDGPDRAAAPAASDWPRRAARGDEGETKLRTDRPLAETDGAGDGGEDEAQLGDQPWDLVFAPELEAIDELNGCFSPSTRHMPR
ncbi:hypothetical protein CDD83_6172 [Cordyceps sp. RAO-2017]|nr:hypothetical protein CDD83_6172 [Cordyceps sp. RAO-2017]